MARRGIRRALLKAYDTDPQQYLVYFWENYNFRAQFTKCRMTLREARAMCRAMCRHFGVRQFPRITTWRGGKSGDMAQQTGPHLRVNTDRAYWTPALLAHETAHWICDYKKVRGQDHGPVWMAAYLHLLDKFKIISLHMTAPSAKMFGIKFKDPTRCF